MKKILKRLRKGKSKRVLTAFFMSFFLIVQLVWPAVTVAVSVDSWQDEKETKTKEENDQTEDDRDDFENSKEEESEKKEADREEKASDSQKQENEQDGSGKEDLREIKEVESETEEASEVNSDNETGEIDLPEEVEIGDENMNLKESSLEREELVDNDDNDNDSEQIYNETDEEDDNDDDLKIGKKSVWDKNDDGSYTTVDPVSVGVKYKIKNSELEIEFNYLEIPQKITIKEVELPNNLGASRNLGYEITSKMPNSTFEYELTLPYDKSEIRGGENEIKVFYTESNKPYEELEKDDFKSVEEDQKVKKKVNKSKSEVEVKNLDHFTIFVVSGVSNWESWDGTGCDGVVNNNGDADYSCFGTISDAIEAAEPGDTISIKNGVFNESLVISKPITLKASDSVVLDGSGLGSEAVGITVNYQNTNPSTSTLVNIKNLKIKNFKKAVVLESTGAVKLKGLDIQNIDDASIEINNSQFVLIEDSFISSNNSGTGIDILANSNFLYIEDNQIKENSIGINNSSLGNEIIANNNSIYSNVSYGVRNGVESSFNAKNNWWGVDSGPKDVTDEVNTGLTNPLGGGNSVTDWVIYDPWEGVRVIKPIINGAPGFGTSIPPAGYMGDGLGIDNYIACGEVITQEGVAFRGVWGEAVTDSSGLLKYERDVVYNGNYIGTYSHDENHTNQFTTVNNPNNPNGGVGEYYVRVRAIDNNGNASITDAEWSNKTPNEDWCKMTINFDQSENIIEVPIVENISFQEPDASSLACDSETNSPNIQVLWSGVEGDNPIDYYVYQVEYSSDGVNFNSVWTTQTTEPQFNGSFLPNGPGLRRVMVKAVDTLGNHSNWAGPCHIEYVELQNQPQDIIEAPQNLGWNREDLSSNFNDGFPDSLDIPCPEIDGTVTVDGSFRLVNNWTSVLGENIRYIRLNYRPDGSKLLLGQNGRVSSANFVNFDENNAQFIADNLSDSYDFNHSNGWATFGAGEGEYLVHVMAFSDLNNNGKLDFDEPVSDWSNSCSITYSTQSQQDPQDLEPQEPSQTLPIVENISFQEPDASSLACDSETNSPNIQVLWSGVEGDNPIDYYVYQVEYSSDGVNFNSVWTTQTTEPQFNGSFLPNGPGLRRVMVKAVDTLGNHSNWAGPCHIEYVELQNQPQDIIEAPQNLGWNRESQSATTNEMPLDVPCGGSTNENSVAQNWSLVIGENIYYQREWLSPGSNSWTTDPFAYPNNYMVNFSTFGGSGGVEGEWSTRVRAYSDPDGTGIINGNEIFSEWSNECKITYDTTHPTMSNIKMFVNGVEGNEAKVGDTVKIVADVLDNLTGVDKIQIWVRHYPWDGRQITSGELMNVSGDTYEFTFEVPLTYQDGSDIDTAFEANYFNFRPWDNVSNSHIGWRHNFTVISDATPPTTTLELDHENSTGYDPVFINVSDLRFKGVATDTQSNIKGVEYRYSSDNGLNWSDWTEALPTSGAFDSMSEDFYFEVTGLADGEYVFEARSFDEALNYEQDPYSNDVVLNVDTVVPDISFTDSSFVDNSFIRGQITIEAFYEGTNAFDNRMHSIFISNPYPVGESVSSWCLSEYVNVESQNYSCVF
jgi:hypothetical protein